MRLGELARWPRNPKRHDEEGVDQSMTRFGFNDPIAIDEASGKIVAGHGRLDVLIARKASGRQPPERVEVVPDGEWLVPVLRGVSFASPAEAEAYLLAHNQLGPSGGYDDRLLAEMLSEHRESESGLVGTGWSDEQVDDLLASMEREAAPLEPTPPDGSPELDGGQHKCPTCGRFL
jgi:hypothetical protein